MDAQTITALIGSLSAISGAIVGGFITIATQRVQFNRQNRKEKRKEIFKRSEELYLLLDGFSSNVISDFIYLSGVMKEKYDYNQYLDSIIDNNNGSKDVNRIPFLIGIYHPNLNDDLKLILELRDEIAKVRSTHKSLYANGDPEHGNILKQFSDLNLQFSNKCDDLKSKIVDSLRSDNLN
ncbi:hypothetical protein [Labrenzia sp. DG1229]|uniref:hypothetical protein n=1 Tax=Labrenzia sp. DG1229 TaxID=681847 RepID=UPI00048FC7C5|nr:hypothetical protein [Labrenzia sp. DG1229]